MRFNNKAETTQDILQYYHRRAVQLLPWGWTWDGTHAVYDWGVAVRFRMPNGIAAYSVYIRNSCVGQGHMGRWLAEHSTLKMVTSDDCADVLSYFKKKQIDYVNVFDARPPEDSMLMRCYRAIEAHYGDKCAKRSGLPLMHHIDEGLYLLRTRVGGPFTPASEVVQAAYCLHPLVQEEQELIANTLSGLLATLPTAPLEMAMDYRKWANAYLSNDLYGSPFVPGGLNGVRMMLQADKIQNFKDFALYLEGHSDVPNTVDLRRYFRAWNNYLGILPFPDIDDIISRTGGLVIRDHPRYNSRWQNGWSRWGVMGLRVS